MKIDHLLRKRKVLPLSYVAQFNTLPLSKYLATAIRSLMWSTAILSTQVMAQEVRVQEVRVQEVRVQEVTPLNSAKETIRITEGDYQEALNQEALSKAATNQEGINRALNESTIMTDAQLPHTTLPTIVVIGEKQSRSLMNTASSVQVFDAQSVDALPETPSLSGIMQHSANVVDTGNGNEVPSIRGIDGAGPAVGANAFLAGTQPRINVSVDGRSLDYHELAFAPQSMWDVQQVEVFKGSQSYIQGRNAIAGAVVIKSADPSFEWGGKLKVGAGTHEHRQYAAMLTGALSEDLAFRFSADRFERESEADLEPYEPVGDPKQIHNTTIRGKLLLEPLGIPELSSQLTLSQTDTKAPQSEAYQPTNPSPRGDARRPVFSNNTKAAIWDLSWQSDSWKFDNTVTYTDFDIQRLTAPKLPYANIDATEWSIEPRIQSDNLLGISDLSGIIGVRMANKTQDEAINLFGGANFDDTTKTQAIYGELTYPISTAVNMTLGLRAQREDRRRYGDTSMITIDLDEEYKAVLPKVNVLWRPNDTTSYGFQVIKGFNPGGAGVTFSRPFTAYQYESESVTNYEVYSRHKLINDKLLLTANAFYNHYEDMQLPYTLPKSQAIVIENADKVVTYGAELHGDLQINDKLIATGNIGYLDTKIKQYQDSGLEGKQLLRAPKLTAGAGVRYQLGNADIASSLNYNSGYYSDLENKSLNKADSFWSVNAEIGYQFKKARFALFANNLFDNDEPIIKYNNGLLGPVYQQPATIGATISYEY